MKIYSGIGCMIPACFNALEVAEDFIISHHIHEQSQLAYLLRTKPIVSALHV